MKISNQIIITKTFWKGCFLVRSKVQLTGKGIRASVANKVGEYFEFMCTKAAIDKIKNDANDVFDMRGMASWEVAKITFK